MATAEDQDLLELVVEMADECYLGRWDEAMVRAAIAVPLGTNPGWPWRDHVPDGFVRVWDRLDFNARLGIFAMACIQVEDYRDT